ncbi:hypothetical protein ABZ490_41205 [Streptomyces sp. NPDC005811]|uniref:hypothetical protein n=1 Tax=Streptomyces sp. NPDC005811 TaxID=3154565 RepID=UPI0033EF2CE3
MMGIGKLSEKQDVVLTIRDADVMAAALREALARATPEERPGLERAAALIAVTATDSDSRLRARWVHDRLSATGFTGDVGSVAAVKALRRAEPRLSLVAAVELQRAAVAHPRA